MAGFTYETEEIDVPNMEVAVAYTPSERTELFIPKSDAWQSHYFITAISTSLETNEPQIKALTDFQTASLLISTNYEAFWKLHENDWLTIWKHGHIKINGNLNLAQAVNSSLYYIIRYVWICS